MTQEHKDLLLKDLCSRLPYGVKVEYENKIFDIDYISAKYGELKLDNYLYNYTIDIGEVKPYLFPLSSMTEEQKKEYNRRKHNIQLVTEWGCVVGKEELFDSPESFEYLIENHFDVYGLIPLGIALDATNLNVY